MRRAQLRLRRITSLLAAGFFVLATGVCAVPRLPGGNRWF
jgi:hypothetical protein